MFSNAVAAKEAMKAKSENDINNTQKEKTEEKPVKIGKKYEKIKSEEAKSKTYKKCV